MAFGAALGGAAVLGGVGAVLALPAAAMATALIGSTGGRHQVVRSELVDVRDHRVWKRWAEMRKLANKRAEHPAPDQLADDESESSKAKH